VPDSENDITEPVWAVPLADVLSFVRRETERPDAEAGEDIFADLHCTAKDFTKLIEKFGRRFNIDTSNYRWYFHTNEEDHSIGGMFFKPPFERVKRIPVTAEMLWEMANVGYWNIEYPEHEIPSSRVDYLINILLFIAGALLLAWIARKW
jgi:hypothetical protein